jgi:hypothetical protein
MDRLDNQSEGKIKDKVIYLTYHSTIDADLCFCIRSL